MVNLTHETNENTGKIKLPTKVRAGKENRHIRNKSHYELQIEIVKHIINNGVSSPYDVEIALNISKVSSSKTFSKMEKKHELITVVSKKVNNGVKRKYFGLTNKGIKWILEKGKLNKDEFWKLLFLIYDIKSKIKPDLTIDEFFLEYESKLGISRYHYNPFSLQDITAKYIKDILKEDNPEIISFLKNLALGKRPKLINRKNQKNTDDEYFIIGDKKMSYYTSVKTVLNHLTFFLVSPNKNKAGNNISVIGILYLLNTLSKEKKYNEIEKIISLNKHLLPNIFSNWPKIKKLSGYNTQKLMEILFRAFSNDFIEIFSEPRAIEEIRILGCQYDLEQLTIDELAGVYKAGIEYAKNWARLHNCYQYLFDPNEKPNNRFFLRLSKYSRHSKNYKKRIQDTIRKSCELIEMQFSDNNLKNNSIKDDLFRYYEPLRKLSEMYMVLDSKVLGHNLREREVEETFYPIQNIISFYFYLILTVEIKQSTGKSFDLKKIKVNGWWNDWIYTLTKFDHLQSKKLENLLVKK